MQVGNQIQYLFIAENESLFLFTVCLVPTLELMLLGIYITEKTSKGGIKGNVILKGEDWRESCIHRLLVLYGTIRAVVNCQPKCLDEPEFQTAKLTVLDFVLQTV